MDAINGREQARDTGYHFVILYLLVHSGLREFMSLVQFLVSTLPLTALNADETSFWAPVDLCDR